MSDGPTNHVTAYNCRSCGEVTYNESQVCTSCTYRGLAVPVLGVPAILAAEPSGYYAAVTAEDERLEATLKAIRADEAEGHLTPREAADNRISVLEAHLQRCQDLRRQHLGNGEHQ